MAIYTCNSTSGDDQANGIDRPVRTITRLNELLSQRGPGGHEVLLRGAFQGQLQVIGGDINNRLNIHGHPDHPFTLHASDGLGAIAVYGNGGLTVSHGTLLGDGRSVAAGLEFANGHFAFGEARSIVLEHLEVEGFGMGGIVVAPFAPIHDVIIRHCVLRRNGNGLHLGGGGIDDRLIRGLYLGYVTAEDNDWEGDNTERPVGHGASLNNVGDYEDGRPAVIEHSRFNRNGTRFTGNPGHDGLLAYNCSDLHLRHNEAIGNWDDKWGDGQGFCFDQCQRVLAEYNLSQGNKNGGFQVLTDTRPGRSQHVIVRHNTSMDDVVGLYLYGDCEDVAFLHNLVQTHAREPGSYRKCLDVTDAFGLATGGAEPDRRARIRFWGNTVLAEHGALSLEVSGRHGLRNISVAGQWLGVPHFVLNGSGFVSLEQLLAAAPVEL